MSGDDLYDGCVFAERDGVPLVRTILHDGKWYQRSDFALVIAERDRARTELAEMVTLIGCLHARFYGVLAEADPGSGFWRAAESAQNHDWDALCSLAGIPDESKPLTSAAHERRADDKEAQ